MDEEREDKLWQQRLEIKVEGRHLSSVLEGVHLLRWRGNNIKEQVMIKRLRIGHSNLNRILHIVGEISNWIM